MRAVRMHEFGGPDVLRLEHIERSAPKQDEVLIRVHSAGVNYSDISRRRGTFRTSASLPYIPGLEAAGIIEEVGAAVTEFRPGDRVLAIMGGGGYAEFVTAKVEQLFLIPEELGFAESTALLVQGMTAVGLLSEAKAGQSILIHAAAGGVGSILVQLAKLKGLRVTGTASSADKLQMIVALGGELGVNYTEPDWGEQARHAVGDRGFDIIIEMVGGKIVGSNLDLLAVNGTMWVYGSASGEDYKLSVLDLLDKNLIVRGYWLTLEPPARRAEFASVLLQHVNEKRLRISVTEYPLERADEAHKAVEGRQTTGKVVLIV
ncbi:MAG: zinc-binding dehydrogenase [Acidobacteriota bacterium]